MRRPRPALQERNRWAEGDSVDVVALGRLDRLGDREAQFTKPEAEGATGDPEELSRPELVAARGLEHQRQELLVDLAVDVLVESSPQPCNSWRRNDSIADLPQPPTRDGFGPGWGGVCGYGAGRDSAVTTGPVTRNSVCLSTLCSSRMFPARSSCATGPSPRGSPREPPGPAPG